MARKYFGIEKLLRIFKTDSDTEHFDIMFGSGLPGGDTGEQDDANAGAVYFRQNGASSTMYQKIGTANSTADWQENGSSQAVIGNWRPEKVRATTNEAVSAGITNPVAWADNDGAVDGNDFIVGEFVIVDADGTPALMEVTVVTSSTSITLAAAATPIANNDTFISINYLPDPVNMEGQAIVNKTSTIMVKIGDVDWNFATGINISSGYASGNGTISSADSVESAIQKLDGNQQDIQSASGLSQGDVNYGSFTTPASLLLAASQTSKQLFQRLGVLLAQLRGVEVTGLTTLAVIDSVPHSSVKCVMWLVCVFEEATPANRKFYEIQAMTDGTLVDDSVKILKMGANFNFVLSIIINGANMELKASSSTAGVTTTIRRIEVVKSVL